MKRTRLPGLFTWSVWQPDRRIDFNGFLWVRPDGNVAFDPMPLGAEQTAIVEAEGGIAAIVLTNADHWRATTELRERFRAEVWAPEGDRDRFGERAEQVDGFFTHAGSLPVGLGAEVAVHELRGGKSPVEIAFYLEPLRALLFGDVVRSHEVGRMCLLPDAKLADRDLVLRDLMRLRDRNVDAVLLGDGDSFLAGARGAFLDLLREVGRRR